FGKVKKTFPNGEYAITSYSQELQTAGRVKQVDYYNKSNTLMQSEINTWVVRANKGTKTDSSGNYLGYDIVLATQELKHYNSGKTLCGTATISYGYDTFGNATTELRKSNDASVVKYNRSYVNQPSDSNYLVGLLAREQAVDPNSNDKPLSDKLIWYDNQALGKGAQGKVTAVKDWLDTFAGMNYGDDTFYSTNSSYPVTTADDPHPLVKYSYDSYGNKTVTTKHNLDLDKKATEQTETVSYDSTYHTFPVTFTNARGQMTTTVVNDYGQPIKVIDPNGGVTTYSYDSLWRVTAEYGPEDGVNPKIKYDYSNALTGIPSTQYIKVQRQIAVGGATYLSSKNYLNGFGRNSREERESAEGKTAYKYWQYEWNGFMSFEGLDSNDSYFGFTRGTFFGYDSLKRPVRIQKADSCSGGLSYTNYTYDGLLTTMKVSDNNSKVLYLVQHSKDAFGRLVSTRQMASEGGPYIGIDYEYDGLDRQTSKRNVDTQSSTTSTMKYDSLGRLMTQVDPFSGTTRFQYDLVGNVLKKTDNDGNQLLYSYDLLNRPTGKSVLVKGTTNLVTLASWVYDESNRENGIGKLTTAKLGSNTVDSVFNYNLEGNLTKTTKFIDGKAYTTESTYDVQNRLTKLTYPDNTEVNYTYDADYLKTVGNYVTYSNWIASGAPQNVTYGNGVTTSYRYNTYADNKLLALETKNSAGTLIQSFGYSYDAAGNILAINDNAPITTMHSTNISQTFTYDGSNRLTSSSVWGFYSYDKMGNILSKEGVTFTYGDTAHPNCPTSASNGYQAGYDANGNLAWKKDSKGIWWKYSYDYENRLTAVYKGTAKGSETLFEEYAYDSAGVRTKKMNYKNNTTTYFINYGTNVLYEKTGALSTKYILNGDGREIARVTGTTTIYTHRDHLGSASVNTDSSGNTVGWYATRPYGEVWNVGTGSVVENHSFTGKETDDSGLVYFGARYYDTEMGRFISVDPAQDGDNWYTYCNNNPLTFIDLFGLTPYYLPGVVYGDNTSMTNTSTGRSITPGTIVSREVVKYGNGSFDVVYTTKEPDRNGELHTTFQETLSFGKKKELTETNLCFSINGRPLLRVRDEWDNKGKVRETVFSWHERTKKEAWWINGTVKNTFFIGSFYFSEAKAIAALPRLLRLGLSWGIDQVVVPDVTKQGETYVEVSTRYYRYW
ncbi:MAG TPA: RHS repeat-associated core domain-containing protein, partial [Bacillota bacterium]|nr:RHS repeat-associated core domain-containing protein [Bacillota bacterium]